MRRLIWVVPLLCLVWGCGGSGPFGGGGQASISYSTVWSSALGSLPDGLSQKVRVFAADGTEATAPQTIEKQSGQPRLDVVVPPGTYRVRVELWSGPGGTGQIAGISEIYLNVNAIVPFDTQVGGNPNRLAVSPGSATFAMPGNQRFAATIRLPNGKAALVPPTSIAWQATGSAGIDAQGILTPTQAGSGQARASFANLAGTAGYHALAYTPTVAKWTILVYMNAASDLNPFAIPNLDQMERVANNADVRFVVQWKEVNELPFGGTFSGTKRLLVRPDNQPGLNSQTIQDLGSGVDMGQAQTLRDFIAWAKIYYPAQRYCLIFWSHGNGWRPLLTEEQPDPTRGISKDEETGNQIATQDIDDAMGPSQFDIVAFDASLMQMFEVAYQIRNKAAYICGSEESPPGAGYPYDLVFQNFQNNPDLPTATLAKGFVDGMLAVPGYAADKITQSVLDSSKLFALAGSLDTLSQELIAHGGSFTPAIQSARTGSQAYSPNGSRTYRDVVDLCLKLEAGAGLPGSTLLALQQVRAKVGEAVVWEGHNALSPGSHGISIDFSNAAAIGPVQAQYNALSFAQDTHWDSWLSIAP